MRFDKLTIKGQEALAEAQSLASSRGHSEITPAHLLRALPGELSIRLLARLTKQQLWGWIRNDQGLRYLHQYLEAEEVACLSEMLEESDAE